MRIPTTLAEATPPGWVDWHQWIPVGIICGLILLVPVITRMVRTAWVTSLGKLPIQRERGVRRIDTIISFFRSLTYFALTLMLVFFALHAVFPEFNPLAATGALSVVALILTGMFKDVVVDVVKGLDILVGAHYDVGDYVEVAGTAGHVVDFQLKYTKLRTASGEEIVLNNAQCIPSRRFRQGWVTNHVGIPLANAADEPTARDVVNRASAELDHQVEAVQDQPTYLESLPLPTTGGVALRYAVNVLPGAKWVMDDYYLPLLKRTLEAAEIPLGGEITYFHMNDIETFRKLFSRSLSREEIQRWAHAQPPAS
jgi:small conductance mechanosensitive channel